MESSQQLGDAEKLRYGEMAGRCKFVARNFFEAVFIGADLNILKENCPRLGDKRALKTLTGCRRATSSEGNLLVVEWVTETPRESAGTMSLGTSTRAFTSFQNRHNFSTSG